MKKEQNQTRQFINQYMAQKAGMNEVDKNKIAQIIKQSTDGSPKSLYEQQMGQKRDLQLAQMLKKTLQYTIQQKRQIKKDWQASIESMKSSRNLLKYWAHLDFDMFYVACEILDKPHLAEIPCAVGGQNSVICTANYIARKYGVRSALPTFIAKKLCSQLVLIPPDFTKYKKYSNIFRDILRRYDSELQSMGLDQAYVQLTQFFKNKNIQQQNQFIQNIRQEIYSKTGLTVSCGVGANKMLAKLASQQKKPNGQFILNNNENQIMEFMKQKKIRKIPGIGPVNEFFLKGLGIECANDILKNLDVIAICFSSNSTQFYISRALGLGQTEHQFTERKSLGKSQTFKATEDIKYLSQKIIQICQEVCMQLQQLGYVSKNIVFTYQNQMFSKKDKTFQLNKYTSNKEEMIQNIIPFLNSIHQIKKQKIRLLGARCTQIMKIEDLRKIQLDKYLKNTNDSQQVSDHKQKGLNFFCPICNLEIDCKGNLSLFNRHIDKCMSSETVQEENKVKSQKRIQNNLKQNQQKRKSQNKPQSVKGNKKTLFDYIKKK